MRSFSSVVLCAIIQSGFFLPSSCFAPAILAKGKASTTALSDDVSSIVDVTPEPHSSNANLPAEALQWKRELVGLAFRTDRGFRASSEDRKKARDLIFELALFNPNHEPAKSYYNNTSGDNNIGDSADLKGKWTLLYTDAPDILSLDGNPFTSLGRIGQECDPPFIKNVIEWKRPGWASSFPFAGKEGSRILQKVITEASSSKENPTIVKLQTAGLQIEATTDDGMVDTNLVSAIGQNGLVAGWFQTLPLDLQGPLRLPFGEFTILYLDDDLRMIRTSQNYVAVNQRVRPGEEWF